MPGYRAGYWPLGDAGPGGERHGQRPAAPQQTSSLYRQVHMGVVAHIGILKRPIENLAEIDAADNSLGGVMANQQPLR
jgi:hypothetical protein